MPTSEKSHVKYLGKALGNHWNLLLLAAGTSFALIAGMADILLPLVGAGELIYLAARSTSRKFQAAVDNAGKQNHKGRTGSAEQAEKLIKALKPEDRAEYRELKKLCLSMQRFNQGDAEGGDKPDDFQNLMYANINQLLWIYLKLLHVRNSLEFYAQNIRPQEIQQKIAEVEERLTSLGSPEQDDANESKLRKSLEDTQAAYALRLQNYQQAAAKHEFVTLELERLHTKISGLAEMGLTRQEPHQIAEEIDVAIGSIKRTESAMQELEFLTELPGQDEKPPDLLAFEMKV